MLRYAAQPINAESETREEHISAHKKQRPIYLRFGEGNDGTLFWIPESTEQRTPTALQLFILFINACIEAYFVVEFTKGYK